MKKVFLLAGIFILNTLLVNAQQKLTPEGIMEKVSKGKPFTLVILKRGNPFPADSKDANDKMQMEHLAHLFQMEQDGKTSIFGPVMNDTTLEGIIVFNSTDKKSIEAELTSDPFIKGGYLRYEMYDWFSIPGQKIPE